MKRILVTLVWGLAVWSCTAPGPEPIVETAQFLSGTIYDANSGQPLGEATVYWGGALAYETQADGRYSIGGFGTLSGTVTFSAHGFVSRTFEMPGELPAQDPDGPIEDIEMDVVLERR